MPADNQIGQSVGANNSALLCNLVRQKWWKIARCDSNGAVRDDNISIYNLRVTRQIILVSVLYTISYHESNSPSTVLAIRNAA